MDITKEEVNNLQKAKQAFNVHTLTRQQVELILRRKLNDRMWKAYETSEQDDVYSIKRLFTEHRQKSKKPNFSYSDVAKHAAKKAQRLQAKQQQQGTDEIYRVAKLFKSKKNSCLLYTSDAADE